MTINTVGSGSVTVNGTAYTVPVTVDEGTSLALVAIPATDWQFDGWSGDASASPVIMDADKTVTATFSLIPIPQYTLTITIVGEGSVTLDPAGGTYLSGTSVQLTAVADSGWSFEGWTVDLVSTNNPEDIIMNSNKNVTATFTEAIISPEDSSMTFDYGQERIRLALIDQNGNRIPGNTLNLNVNMWKVFQGVDERSITAINYGTPGAKWDVEIFVSEPTANPKPTVKYYGYDPNDPVIIYWK